MVVWVPTEWPWEDTGLVILLSLSHDADACPSRQLPFIFITLIRIDSAFPHLLASVSLPVVQRLLQVFLIPRSSTQTLPRHLVTNHNHGG